MTSSIPRMFRKAAGIPFDWSEFKRLIDKGLLEEAFATIVPGKDYDQPSAAGGLTPLEYCLSRHEEKAALKFIEHGASVTRRNPDGETPLRVAAARGLAKAVQLLIAKGAGVNDGGTDGLTPLQGAAGFRTGLEAMKILIQKGASVDKAAHDGTTPLMWAANNGRDAAMKLLLEKGAVPDRIDDNGNSALHYAATGASAACAALLIDAGAAMDLRNRDGQTPLLLAAPDTGDNGFARLLLARGADPNIADDDGLTPLMQLAARRREDALTKMVIAKGADLDARDSRWGRTALSLAADFPNSVKLLVEAGADPTVTDGRGLTAYDYAVAPPLPGGQAKDPACARMLKEAEEAWARRPDQRAIASITVQAPIRVSRPLTLRTALKS